MKYSWTIAALLFFVMTAGLARSEVSCHCFSERKYDPAAPFMADPYILATARNSLISGATGTGKGDVVKLRMGGSGEADLWFSLYLGPLVGVAPEVLTKARGNSISWAEAVKSIKKPVVGAGNAFASGLQSGDELKMLYALADRAMEEGMRAGPEALKRLRGLGTDNAQTAIMLLIAEKKPGDPAPLLSEIYGGKKSWGQALAETGILPENAGKEIILKFSAPK